jgi:glutathione S-transferase
MLKLWGRATSQNVQKAMWAIGELGLDHERIDVGGRFGGLDTPEFGAMNPNRRVPVLEHDGAVIWESHTVVRYLAATFGRGTLWAEDPAERSLADRQLTDRPYVAGEHLTMGDIPIGASLYRYFELDLERPPRPKVEAYYARLQDRPAYRQHVMVPFEELKGRTDF